MSIQMIKTNKFNEMIRTFDADLDLALNGETKLSELQELINEKDERLLNDIELLNELSFLLRHNKAEIHIMAETLWFIVYVDENGYVCEVCSNISDNTKVLVFENETEATIALGNLKKHDSIYENAKVKSFAVKENGKFVDGRDYTLLTYKNGQFI